MALYAVTGYSEKYSGFLNIWEAESEVDALLKSARLTVAHWGDAHHYGIHAERNRRPG